MNQQRGSIFVNVLLLLFLVAIGVAGWQYYLSAHKQGTVYETVLNLVQQQSGATVTGTIIIGPVTPVCHVNVPCETPLTNHVVQALDTAGAVAAVTQTDSTGHYTLHLRPGSYTIALKPRLGIGSSQDKHITVHSGNNTLDIAVDTGIR